MKPPEFDYVAPASLGEVASLLHEEEDAKLLAGGQSLVPLLNFRLAAPTLLIDLRHVAGLAGVERLGDTMRIGAMLTQRAAENHAALDDSVPLLRSALRHVSHPQIRSRGTLGGSIAHADPAAELPALLLALDGAVYAHSVRGERRVEAGDLFRSFFTTSLDPDEAIVAVELPVAPPRTGTACVEIAQRAGDYAICGALVQLTLAPGGEVEEARVALFGVGQRPERARGVEAQLRGETPTVERLVEAAAHAAEGLAPQSDRQASAGYRKHLARVLVRRGLEQALAGIAA